ncbi:LOW QUALITY PROTEIN: carbonyl reductase [NADPH] 1-like [Diprion similis]|uniref:LOW QUALITY PROTEIN: carbonyl reductase [NADPH] 1-like n=1 Tax=Diprion similis TaxID=362088 RepID=UPI001EF7C09A|nr:LOW QUALITY PROTEIN: carbonyl reductase [NADPH] 1-like [Diprion similis]
MGACAMAFRSGMQKGLIHTGSSPGQESLISLGEVSYSVPHSTQRAAPWPDLFIMKHLFTISLVFIGILWSNAVFSVVGTINIDVNRTARVAVVTGGNKGVGFATVKGLCQRFNGIVYLTARSVARGQAAAEKLRKIGFQPRFHQLDITDDSSINAFKTYLNDTHGGLDILINNAGISFKKNATEPFPVQASETVRVNYFGLLRVSKALFPLLRPHARVVHVSSAFGRLPLIPGNEIRARFSNSELTEEGLNQIMRDFVEATKRNNYQASGWPDNPYMVSKVGVSALTGIQQKAFNANAKEDLVVNAVHPGYVNTDLTDHMGTFTPERGSQSSLYAALLPQNTEIKGKYIWHDNTLVDWANGPRPAA